MIRPICQAAPDHPDETCATAQVTCVDPPDSYKYWIYRSTDGGPFVPVASTCLGPGEAGGFDVITPGKVYQQMATMSWPAADLLIQPPDGRTLVNFETNFLTTTTQPTTQTITLLGQRVEITATPVTYTWHFGDGTTQTGTDPGAPYPDLRITHLYTHAHLTVRPSVDVTYHGSYTINAGNPQDIPEELTVDGAPVDLEILSATPRLVG